jgi:hypothetical protein
MKSIKITLFFSILFVINACNGDASNESNGTDTMSRSTDDYPSATPAVDTFATDTSNFTNGPDNAAPQSSDTSAQ